MPFRALGLDDRIFKAIQDAGYTEPTPIQTAAIPEILAGRDVIGIAQTGTGKTAAFTLPILSLIAGAKPRPGMRALMIAPTRELVVQIEENVRAYAKHLPLRMATVYGGVSERPQIAALRAGVELVVATPGRLIDLMEQRQTNFSNVEFLVLDEADINAFLASPEVAQRLAQIKIGSLNQAQSRERDRYKIKDPAIEFLTGETADSAAPENRIRVTLELEDLVQASNLQIEAEVSLSISAGDRLTLINPTLTANGSPVPPQLINAVLPCPRLVGEVAVGDGQVEQLLKLGDEPEGGLG